MFPLNKKEKRGKSWAIILLFAPLILMGISGVWEIYNNYFDSLTPSNLVILGIIYAILGLITLATYLGKLWGHILLILINVSTSLYSLWSYQEYYPLLEQPTSALLEALSSLIFYLLPPFLLFLPAPNAFLRYQREKETRHLAVLEHQLSQIGEDE